MYCIKLWTGFTWKFITLQSPSPLVSAYCIHTLQLNTVRRFKFSFIFAKTSTLIAPSSKYIKIYKEHRLWIDYPIMTQKKRWWIELCTAEQIPGLYLFNEEQGRHERMKVRGGRGTTYGAIIGISRYQGPPGEKKHYKEGIKVSQVITIFFSLLFFFNVFFSSFLFFFVTLNICKHDICVKLFMCNIINYLLIPFHVLTLIVQISGNFQPR